MHATSVIHVRFSNSHPGLAGSACHVCLLFGTCNNVNGTKDRAGPLSRSAFRVVANLEPDLLFKVSDVARVGDDTKILLRLFEPQPEVLL